MINEFKDKYFFLSNFYAAPVEYGGITYLNNEAAFHAQKTFDDDLRATFANLNPSEAKKMGRKVQLRSDWEDVKEYIMFDICLNKFEQNPNLSKRLLATGDQELIEGNWWHDNYWGDCSCDRCKNVKGRNKLGKILMEVRALIEIQEELK